MKCKECLEFEQVVFEKLPPFVKLVSPFRNSTSNSNILPWGVVVLYIGVVLMCKTTPQGEIYIYLLCNLLPKQHHCTREIWATFLDVAWVINKIMN